MCQAAFRRSSRLRLIGPRSASCLLFFSVSKRFVVESDRRVKRWGGGEFMCLISGVASMSSH